MLDETKILQYLFEKKVISEDVFLESFLKVKKKMSFRRICLFGGPGSGKSTFASFLFSKLKFEKIKTELITEYVKQWAYLNRNPEKFDQVFLFGNQMQSEYIPLKNNVQVIVTDSPLYLSAYYAKKLGLNYKNIISLAEEFDNEYKPLNILMLRDVSRYDSYGRFHSLNEAIAIDNQIFDFLSNEIGMKFGLYVSDDYEDASQKVCSILKNGEK